MNGTGGPEGLGSGVGISRKTSCSENGRTLE